MDFSEVHKINLKNENTRKQNNIPTFKSLLAGVSLAELKPNPLKCNCGHYPKIEQSGNEYDAICANKECDHGLFNVGSTYQEAIFQWNESNDTEFNPELNKIHPLAWYTVGFDSAEYLFKQIKRIESCLVKIESAYVTNKESRLIRLIRGWNHFATIIASRIQKESDSQKTPIVPTQKKEYEDKPAHQEITNSNTSHDTGVANRLYTPDIKINGPMSEYKDQIQVVGSAHYWLAEGHMVRTKVCKHTSWLVPTYIVYVHNKGTHPGYQVRIDLRSIGVPYYSKMFNSKDIFQSLSDAMIDLKQQLKRLKHTRKLGNLIERSRLKSKNTIILDEIKGVRTIKSIWDSNHRVEITFSSPNDQSKARIQWSIGGKTSLTYRSYKKAITNAVKMYLLHTKFSCSKAFSHGARVSLSDLDTITQMKIVDVVCEHFDLGASDVAYYLARLNPSVHIGYLPLASLREDNTLQLGEYPMQIVSNTVKRGYLSGKVKRHDLLHNAECVCIDTIIFSNFQDYVYQPNDVSFKEALPLMGLLLSKRAVEMTVTTNPDKNEEFSDIGLLTPEELVKYMQEELINEVHNNIDIFQGQKMEFREEDNQIILYLDGVRTLASSKLDDWGDSYEAASTQTLITAYVLLSGRRLMQRTKTEKRKDLSNRYNALKLTEDDIDLGNVRFLAARASQCGIRSLYIKPSGKVEFHQKKSQIHEHNRILFTPPNSALEFESIVESIYSQLVPFNNDEKKLIMHAYSIHFGKIK